MAEDAAAEGKATRDAQESYRRSKMDNEQLRWERQEAVRKEERDEAARIRKEERDEAAIIRQEEKAEAIRLAAVAKEQRDHDLKMLQLQMTGKQG